MTTLEDRLRNLMTERAAHLPPQAEPYDGVRRRIRRTHQRRAVVGGTLAAVALVGVVVALPGGGRHGGVTPQPRPVGALPATLAPGGGPEQITAAGVRVPANGLTLVVDCGGGDPALVIRVNGRWFSAFDCRNPAAQFPNSLALRPADYRRFDLQVGSLTTVAVSDIDAQDIDVSGRLLWRVHVEAGLPAVAAPVVPEPTRLPKDRTPGVIASIAPGPEGGPYQSGAATFTITSPRAGMDIVISCLYPGTITVEVTSADGSPIASTTERCTGILWPNGEGTQVVRDTATVPGEPRRVTVRVTTHLFTHPTWRVDAVAHRP
jgi:hypothetical protein